jgi:hypothetical protein
MTSTPGRRLADFHLLDGSRFELFENDDIAGKFTGDMRYFAGIIRRLVATEAGRDLRYHVTAWLDDREVVGRDVVVLMVGDERYQVPACTPDVLAVLKTGGLTPPALSELSLGSPRLWLLESMRAARNRREASRRGRHFGLPVSPNNVFHLPLGYFLQVEQPVVPPRDRPIDVCFAGGFFPSGGGRLSAGLRPRTFIRAQLTRVLDRWRPAGLRVELHPSRPGEPPLGPEAYSRLLADSKIALCPRGNFPETFRTIEAARAGCVLVRDVQAHAWYYRDLPGEPMPHWSRLPALLERMLADPQQLQAQHEASLRWWRQVVSEDAVAGKIADWLAKLRKS